MHGADATNECNISFVPVHPISSEYFKLLHELHEPLRIQNKVRAVVEAKDLTVYGFAHLYPHADSFVSSTGTGVLENRHRSDGILDRTIVLVVEN